MNILGDFIHRVNSLHEGIDNEDLEQFQTTIQNLEEQVAVKDAEISRLKARLEKLAPEAAEEESNQKAPAAKGTRKRAAKKDGDNK
jgi:alpha-amylase